MVVLVALRGHLHYSFVDIEARAFEELSGQWGWHEVVRRSQVGKEQVLDGHAHVLERLVEPALEGRFTVQTFLLKIGSDAERGLKLGRECCWRSAVPFPI